MGERIVIEKWAENLEEVTIGRWLVGEGERVEAGQSLCEIITEKVTFEYECPVSGVLVRIYAPEKSVVPVGYTIAYIGQEGEQPPAVIEEENERIMQMHAAQPQLDVDLSPQTPSAGRRARVRAVPAARRLARQHGISLAQVAEWLKENRPITPEDVARYIEETTGK